MESAHTIARVSIYREFVWIIDNYTTPGPPFLQTFAANTLRFVQTWRSVALPLIFFFVALF